VLVGRARHQAGALSSQLRSLGARVIEIPFIEIRKPRTYRALDSALKQIKTYDWLILTSANGVTAMRERAKALHIRKRQFADVRIAAIGPATEKAIEKVGLHVDVVPEEYVAESVVSALRGRVSGKRVLLVRAKVARDVIPRELRAAGAEVDVVEAYETIVPKSSRSRLHSLLKSAADRPHFVTFTSSSTAKNFLALVGSSRAKKLTDIKFASIGPVTSATLRDLGLPAHIEAAEYTIPGLIQSIVAAAGNPDKRTAK
jgi:uroporphyrinogen-III synthase